MREPHYIETKPGSPTRRSEPESTTSTAASAGEPSARAATPDTRLELNANLLGDLQYFNREQTPARAIFAKGCGAAGTFTVTRDITAFTSARLFARIGRQTDVVARFSNAGGERGSADAERDIRGFALRFYTDEGNWDLVGSNLPVYHINDPTHFVELAHAQQRDPRTNLRDPGMRWDFWSNHPESTHLVTMLYSDRGRPDGFRFMHGFGVHAFSLIDASGVRVWCKFQLKSCQGTRNISDADEARIIGHDRDSAQRDLHEAISRGDFPRWRLLVQIMTDAQARSLRWDPFDITRIWPHAQYPLQEIGEIELNRNPENHSAEIEQAAFRPGALVPGIGTSPCPMLQARLAAYADAQFHRLGTNHEQLLVNRSRCPVAGFIKARFAGLSPHDHPPAATQCGAACARPAATTEADSSAWRRSARPNGDDFTQAGDLYRRFDDAHRDRLARRIAGELLATRTDIQLRQLAHFIRADEDYGRRVAAALGLDRDELRAMATAARVTEQPALLGAD